ncbi:RING finger protein 11-like [Corticium candelabrum]|uniref:RING finger protein 11-like n=1 Tax=Corticium candelabrum TaxID=121492 RepID=UPI002E272BA0|nr:RING finger protein 11-like [Corticium candelabrum]
MGNCNCVRRQSTDEIYPYRVSEGDSTSRQTLLGPPPPYEVSSPSSGSPRHHVALSEEARIEYVQKIQRFALLQHLPTTAYDVSKETKRRECPICMMDFAIGDQIRLMPCMHIYHRDCVDDWLIRSFTCPTCMEDVDIQMLQSLSSNPVS